MACTEDKNVIPGCSYSRQYWQSSGCVGMEIFSTNCFANYSRGPKYLQNIWKDRLSLSFLLQVKIFILPLYPY